MKVSRLPFTRLVIGTVAGIGLFSSLLAQPSWSEPYNQDNRVDPLQDLNPQQSTNPFSRQAQGDNLGMMDMIRRLSQGNNGRSLGDYSADQSENLDTAAAQFRARQLQRLGGQHQGTPANSGAKP